MGQGTAHGFYAIMVERALVRIRRVKLGWPAEWWTANWVFQRIRLTNVKRADDRTSKAVQAEAEKIRSQWESSMVKQDILNVPWNEQQKTVAAGLIFTVALWRAFGTALAIHCLGLQLHDWDPCKQRQVAASLASAALEEFATNMHAKEFCLTHAYAPARMLTAKEMRYIRSHDRHGLEQLYYGVCSGAVKGIFAARLKLAHAAQNGPRVLTQAVMKVSGFGGRLFDCQG